MYLSVKTLRFIILNTVAKLDAAHPNAACIGEDYAEPIANRLASEELNSFFNIAVSHHGVPIIPDPDAPAPGEWVDDWDENGRNFFTACGIDMWLFGHRHEYQAGPLNKPLQKPVGLVQILTLRIAPPETCGIPKTRGFCVLELLRNAGEVKKAIVHHYEILENGGIITHKEAETVFVQRE